MSDRSLFFKWRHFEAEIILCAVRWYLRYALNYRDVEELLRERSVSADHTTVFRWVQRYAPELDRRCRPYLRATNDSHRVDEICIKIKSSPSNLFLQHSRQQRPYCLASRASRMAPGDIGSPVRRTPMAW
jgi:transposase-like protein